MKKSLILLLLLVTYNFSWSQESTQDIVDIIDELRNDWDLEAEKMETYVGIKEYCHSKHYQKKVMKLLTTIHHYDTTLFNIVSEKYDVNNDAAAKETLDDILLIETKYTNPNFKLYLKEECEKVISIEKNQAKKGSGDFDSDISALEDELIYYIDAITERIDLVDEHIHHLGDFDE